MLLDWYAVHGRHGLPWRATRDPYAVLVSEVMLQQTQADRVAGYYGTWMARWPGFHALAAASPAEVIRTWAGLGYNRRALHLQRTAIDVEARHGGALPRSGAELMRLPGIGPYTASAVRAFAWDEAEPVLDTNIARVIARDRLGAASQRGIKPGDLTTTAAGLLPVAGGREHNLALMDLGALVCRARRPACDRCPVAATCAWRASGYPAGDARGAATPRFEDTARFARGRIVAKLRDGAATDGDLEQALPEGHHPQVGAYLAGLERDGLALRLADGRWALPGDS